MSQNNPGDTSDRELSVTRIFDAPRDVVFRMWSDPRHLSQWWGPAGFRTTTYKMDFKPGGQWRFVMHGPDGTDYENLITYREIVAPERIAYQHGDDSDRDAVLFETTATFDVLGPNRTRMTLRALFPSAEALKHAIEKYGADKGMHEHVGRLGERLASLTAGGPAESEFVIIRTFNAPRDVVYKAWTELEHLKQWWGPKGMTIHSCKLDPRPGGTFFYGMKSGERGEMWAKWVFREIVPPQRIVFVLSFTDAAGNIVRAPFLAVWPLEVLSMITFAAHEGKTTITMHGVPINATKEEILAFKNFHESMTMGWTGTLDQLERFLSK